MTYAHSEIFSQVPEKRKSTRHVAPDAFGIAEYISEKLCHAYRSARCIMVKNDAIHKTKRRCDYISSKLVLKSSGKYFTRPRNLHVAWADIDFILKRNFKYIYIYIFNPTFYYTYIFFFFNFIYIYIYLYLFIYTYMCIFHNFLMKFFYDFYFFKVQQYFCPVKCHTLFFLFIH